MAPAAPITTWVDGHDFNRAVVDGDLLFRPHGYNFDQPEPEKVESLRATEYRLGFATNHDVSLMEVFDELQEAKDSMICSTRWSIPSNKNSTKQRLATCW